MKIGIQRIIINPQYHRPPSIVINIWLYRVVGLLFYYSRHILPTLICFAGGTDLAGNPLITFPIHSATDNKDWELEGACKYLVYLQDVIFLVMKRKSAAFVANFRQGCTENVITEVVKALEHLEVNIIIIYF